MTFHKSHGGVPSKPFWRTDTAGMTNSDFAWLYLIELTGSFRNLSACRRFRNRAGDMNTARRLILSVVKVFDERVEMVSISKIAHSGACAGSVP